MAGRFEAARGHGQQSSKPGELPPELLTEPDVKLSLHPARPMKPFKIQAIPNAQIAVAVGF